jgi:hypothetical protein
MDMRYVQLCLDDARFTDVVVDVGELVVQGRGRWKNFRKQKRSVRRVRRAPFDCVGE